MTIAHGTIVRGPCSLAWGVAVRDCDQFQYISWLWDDRWEEPQAAVAMDSLEIFRGDEPEIPDAVIIAQTRVMLGGEPWLDTTTEPDKVNSNEEA